VNGHGKPSGSHKSARGVAWAVLVGIGLTTITFNVYHAFHAGRMPAPLDVLYGMVPITLAMGLSHIVAAYRGGLVMKTVTFAVMGAAMWLSISAVAAVVTAAAGGNRWLFGLAMDAGTLMALHVVLTPRGPVSAEVMARAAETVADVPAADAITVPVGEPAGEPGGFLEMPRPDAMDGFPVASGDETMASGPAGEPDEPDGGSDSEPDGERELRLQAHERYRRSKRDARRTGGRPITDRKLGEEFGRSRTWGANRIAEVDSGPKLAEATR